MKTLLYAVKSNSLTFFLIPNNIKSTEGSHFLCSHFLGRKLFESQPLMHAYHLRLANIDICLNTSSMYIGMRKYAKELDFTAYNKVLTIRFTLFVYL